MNKRAVEALIRSGALDGLGANRAQMLHCYEELVEQMSGRGGITGQMDLFGTEQVGFSYPQMPDLSVREKLRMEKETCGMCVSGHLLDDYAEHVQALDAFLPTSLFSSIEEGGKKDGDIVTVCGIIQERTDKTTKNGDPMAFCLLEDRGGVLELIFFPKVFAQVQGMIRRDVGIAVQGRISRKEEEIKLLVDRAVPLIPTVRFHKQTYQSPFAPISQPQRAVSAPVPAPQPKSEKEPLRTSNPDPTQERRGPVYLKVEDMEGKAFQKAVTLCQIFDGACEVVFYRISDGKYIKASHLSLDATDFVLSELRSVLGKDSVVLKQK